MPKLLILALICSSIALLSMCESGGGGSNNPQNANGSGLDDLTDVSSGTADSIDDLVMDTGSSDIHLSGDVSAQPGDIATGEDAASKPAEACTLNSRVGFFEVANWQGYATVAGEVSEGVIPLTVLQPLEQEGGCWLMRRENPFCDPPCGAGQLCDHSSQCIPYPEKKDVGTVTISGLKESVEMTPDPVNNYYDTTVPYPLFDPASPIELIATGGDLEGFSLSATGVVTLEVPDIEWTMKKNEPLALSWVPVVSGAHIYLSINVDQHGNSPVTMFCNFEDNGSAEIPSTLVTKLLEYGVSGFATADIYRRTLDSTNISAGCVELVVFSHVQGLLKVEGHVPCFTNADCPPGETCKVEINTCVQ